MRKLIILPGLALVLAACGGAANTGPDDPGEPGPGPEACRETLSGTVRTSLHLQNSGDGCDYLITGDNLNVEARITADPGALIVVDAGTRIMVREGGSIAIGGSAGSPVTFMGNVQEQGSWDGFCFSVGHDASSFDHVHVVWGGRNAVDTSSTQCRGAIGSLGDYAPISITNSIIFGSGTTGIEATRMELGAFSNNRLAGNSEYGIRVSGENVRALDTATDYAGEESVLPDGSVTPNGTPYVYVRPSAIGVSTVGITHTWKDLGVPYHVASDSPGYTGGSLPFNPGTRVAIEAGTTLLIGPDITLNVDDGAVLGLFGTADEPVIITADTESAAPGHWDGIKVNGGGLIASHARISHGGQASGLGRLRGGVGFFSSKSTRPCSNLENTLISHSETYGVQIDPSYSDSVNLASTVEYANNTLSDVSGTASGPVVTTLDEALDCM